VYGVGPVLAAKLLGHTGDITRFPDRDHFASYTGTAPSRPPAATSAGIG
jgi:transposase